MALTYRDVAEMIKAVDLPFAYDHFNERKKPIAPPFICYIYPDNDDVFADNKNYQKIKRLQIELYTDNKDFDLEERLEKVLETYCLTYRDEEGYLDDEKMYMHTYTMEVVISAEQD